MFTICDLQLEPGRFHYITDLKFLSHASVTTLYSINLGPAFITEHTLYLFLAKTELVKSDKERKDLEVHIKFIKLKARV